MKCVGALVLQTCWTLLLLIPSSQAQCTQGEVRLQGGSAARGRVEICNNNIWGTVCDDLWGTADAHVVCRQLGFSENSGAVALTSGFTNGVGQIWLSDVRCRGTETSLTNCSHSGFGAHSCTHLEDAGVRCTTCIQGDIRLQGGNATSGRVEICNSNEWGTVCNDSWDEIDARVVCSQLGFEATDSVALTSGFTDGGGQTWISNVRCRGTETRLTDCTHSGFGLNSCTHAEDAGVVCFPCTQGDIRLQGGTATTGRVEICNNNVWGTVCDDFWGTIDAQVVCRQLGHQISGASIRTFGFTNGVGRIWLDDVHCRGNETRLIDCPARPLGSHGCSHVEDAGVRCIPCTSGDIRLQGGTATSGRVEICQRSEWGTVCYDFWGPADAQVACRQLGFEPTGAVAITSGYTKGTGRIWLSELRCTGNEISLTSCSSAGLGSHTCSHEQDAGVMCISCSPQGAIRLQGGTATIGRVEICNDNIWGTVCDDFWGTTDAQVACRQLGFEPIGAIALTRGYTNGAGQIWLSNAQCRGSESRLIDCPANNLGVHHCGHSEDAGVRCPTCTNGAIRLRGGNATSGRVEICFNTVWGTLCGNELWDIKEAQVVCRQLGYESTGAIALTDGFAIGAGQIWLSDVQCDGNETRLSDCTIPALRNSNCSHDDDAGVSCPICPQGAIRLREGTATSGRVEICNNAVWGTVCDDGFGSLDAQVACVQLGFFAAGARVLSRFSVRDGSGPIWLDDLSCRGTETRLIDCSSRTLGTHNCRHSDDIGVSCQRTGPTCTQGAIRLQGRSSTQGRVEICNNNIWGTVCNDLWGVADAQVTCRQLGFESAGASTLFSFSFTRGVGVIWLSDVQCEGNETRLVDCPASDFGSNTCNHFEDVGISCPTCTQGDIRLQGGTATSGRVEICNNNVWGTVCDDDFWGTTEARVVCRQLGFDDAVLLTSGFINGAGQIWLANVQCRGNETKLTDCNIPAFGTPRCTHINDAGVMCTPCSPQGAIRLTQGNSGRVEICNDGKWGTVCHDRWSSADAQVVCRQLGFLTTGALPLSGFSVPDGSGPIWLDNVGCRGTETRLVDCPASPLGNHNCVHAEDAGVRCQVSTGTCPQGALRLQGGTARSGRVEICNNNVWGTVCDDLWGAVEAEVVCSQLGFSSAGAFALTSGFTNGIGQIWLDNVACDGNETRLIDCPANFLGLHDCRHIKDAGVNCTIDCLQNSVPVLRAVRSSPITLELSVSLQNVNPATIIRISYFTNPRAEFDQSNLVGTIQANRSDLSIDDLNPCLSYWVVMTTEIIGCDNQLSTEPQAIDLFQSSPFKFSLSVEDITCREWIAQDPAGKISDLENTINSEIETSCGTSAPCMADSKFTCDGRETNFETVLVSSSSLSSQQQLNCLNTWLSSSQSFDINGVPAMISANAPTTENLTPEVVASSSIPAYMWPILLIAVAGVLTSVILVAFILLKMCKKKQSGNFTNESDSVTLCPQPASNNYEYPSLDEKLDEMKLDGTAI